MVGSCHQGALEVGVDEIVCHARRSRTRATCTADHLPCPRAVGMAWSFKPAAMARSDVAPASCSALTVGPMSAARALARRCRTAAERARVATETEFNRIGGLPIYIRIVPVRGTFRTGERMFQCKRFMPLSPLGAQ
jgi:hypothetical protein